jgi:hypothetical protein
LYDIDLDKLAQEIEMGKSTKFRTYNSEAWSRMSHIDEWVPETIM